MFCLNLKKMYAKKSHNMSTLAVNCVRETTADNAVGCSMCLEKNVFYHLRKSTFMFEGATIVYATIAPFHGGWGD